MAERAPKRKTNAKRDQPGVLGTLPASRPERIGKPRRGAGEPAAKPPAPKRRPKAKPEAVSPGSPPLRATRAKDRHALADKPLGPPTGTELVTTTIRAAGELAQIGFVVGGQVLKRTIDRIPRP
jgi:hypothetical protein